MSESMSGLSDFDWSVRAHIYRSFAETGQAPAIAELAALVSGTEHQVHISLEVLFAAHEVALRPDGGGVWMANPFSAVPTDFEVETPSMTCFSPCAWDALGVGAILDTDAWTRTHCAESGETMEFGVRDGQVAGDGVIHLVTPIGQAWKDIGFT